MIFPSEHGSNAAIMRRQRGKLKAPSQTNYLTAYLQKPDQGKNIDTAGSNTHRLAFRLEYRQVNEVEYLLPTERIMFKKTTIKSRATRAYGSKFRND